MKKQTATLLVFLTILFSFVVPVNSYNIEANTQPGIFSKDEIYCELSESDIFQALKENPFSTVKLLMKYAFNRTYVIYEKFKSLFAANHEKWIDGKIKEIKKDYFVVIPDSEDELFGIADEVYINSKDVAGNSLTKNLKKSDHIRVMYNPNSLEFKDEKWQIGIAFAVYKYNSKGELIIE